MKELDEFRNAHSTGYTFASCYKTDDSSYITVGEDGEIKLFPDVYEDEVSTKTISTKIACCALKDDVLVVATNKNEVKSFSLPDVSLQNVLLRFPSMVNHVSLSKDGQLVCASSSDFTVKVVEMDGTNHKTLSGHDAPVLSSSIVDKKRLISCSCDGTLKIWDIETLKCIKTVNNALEKYNSSADHTCVLSCTKETVAVPYKKQIKMYSTESLEEIRILDTNHSDDLSIVKFSDCGKYLCTAAKNGEVFVWETSRWSCILKYQHPSQKFVSSIQWKKGKDLILADEEGSFGVFPALPEHEDKKMEGYNDDDLASTLLNDECMEDNNEGAENDALGEEDDGDAILTKSASKKSKKRAFVDDDDEDDNDGGDDVESAAKKHRINNSDIFLDGLDDDDDPNDENNISLNLIKEGLISDPAKPKVIDDDDDLDSLANFVVPSKEKDTSQDVDVKNQVWNSVGIIRCHSEDDISSLDVEFHNSSTSHPLHFPNVSNNTMAALADTVVAFACQRQDGSASKLTINHFASWDNNKEWMVSMPDKENIEAIAVNSTHIVVATSERNLRIFTVSGLQIHLHHLPGKVVAVAMHKKQMLVLYHKATGLKDSQALGILQLRCHNGSSWRVTSDEVMSLKEKVTIVWCGYSTEGTPALVDSSGNILLQQRKHSTWMNIGNTKKQTKNKSDNYWVVGIEERTAQIKCMYCKASNFPATLPAPVPQFIPFQIPLCESTAEKTMKEHELMKNELISSNLSYNAKNSLSSVNTDFDAYETQQAQLLMQLFALSCKADRDFRAVEVGRLMSLDSLGLAIQYASKIRRMGIAKRLTEIAQAKASEQDKDSDEEEDGDDVMDEDMEEASDVDIEEANLSDFGEMDGDELMISEKENKVADISKKNKSQTLSLKPRSRPTTEIKHQNEDAHISLKTKKDDAAKPEARGISNTPVNNPFKTSNQKKDSGTRGTNYFETLSSKSSTKLKPAAKQNTASNAKKKTVKLPSKKTRSIDFNKKNNNDEKILKENENSSSKENENTSNAPKLTGFQLFMKKENTEKSLPEMMKEWKALSSEDKEFWNNKTKSSDDNIVVEKKDVNISQKSNPFKQSGKDKLSAFSFGKS